MPNPFEKATEIDRKKASELLARSTKDYNETILRARECLKSEQFKEYLLRCNETASTLFDLFLSTPSSDTVTEAIRVKINAMRLLGVDVLRTANLELRQIKSEK